MHPSGHRSRLAFFRSSLDARPGIAWLAAVALIVAGLAVPAAGQQPEIPIFERDVHLIDDGTALYPAMPPVRTSADGRIGLDFKNKRLFLVTPERLVAPFLESPPGVGVILDTGGIQLAETVLHSLPPAAVGLRHGALCDRGYASPSCASGRCPNPEPCGGDDCYHLTVITPVRRDDLSPITIELWSTDVTLRASSPKTAPATMSVDALATPVQGPSHPMTTLFETMVTADGKLIVGRVGGSHRTLGNKFDIVYSVASGATEACDVAGWQAFKPITQAHGDPAMAGYGFAAYPLRDPTGAPIPDDDDLRGTYPWIDRDGNNLFFTTVHSTLWFRVNGSQPFQARYTTSCVPGTVCVPDGSLTFGGTGDPNSVQTHDEVSDTRGTSVAGLWTHGKVVLLDGLINNLDYGMRIPSHLQREVQLYAPGTDPQGGGDGKVRIGTGRHNGGGAGVYPPGYVNNSTFIDSGEQLYNADPDLFPLTLRDVVWIVNTGHASDEVAFDDWVDPNAFVVSEMTAALAWAGGAIGSRYDIFDGFERTGTWTGLGFTGVQPVRVQNAATAVPTEWAIPPFGEVFGNGRIEPAALGGIRGKGLWLDGATGVRYDVVNPQPQDPDTRHWFVGLFLDPRFADDAVRRLLVAFPDGSRLDLTGLDTLHLKSAAGTDLATYALPASQAFPEHAWGHLGILIDPGGTRVRLYRDGDRVRTWNAGAGQSLFRMVPPGALGALSVGKLEGGVEPGFVGWIDEFKVLAHQPNAEVICNHARGTVVERRLLDVFPTAGDPAAIEVEEEVIAVPKTQRFCFHDYTREPGAHLGNLPAGAKPLRHQLLFPEGPLVWNQPRPDSSANAFCLSCHVDTHATASLRVEALTPQPTLMYLDPRRQPSHPPALISGHIPADFYGPGAPATGFVAPAEGEIQDRWVFPD